MKTKTRVLFRPETMLLFAAQAARGGAHCVAYWALINHKEDPKRSLLSKKVSVIYVEYSSCDAAPETNVSTVSGDLHGIVLRRAM